MRTILLISLLTILLPEFTKSQIIKTIVGNGVAGYSGDGGLAVNAQLNHPDKIKFDNAGNLYIADEHNSVIRKINSSGVISTVAGNGIMGYSGDGGLATNAQLSKPIDIAFDAAGNMYIGDFGNGTIRKVNSAGIISTIAGTGMLGYSGDGGPATAAKIYDPLGLVFDNAGNLYFSDNGMFRIRKIDPSGIITTIAGTGVGGFSGDGGPATAAKIRLSGYMAISADGELYIPDYGNHRVRKISTSGVITTLIGDGTDLNSGDGGLASAATLKSPLSILFDYSENIIISDRLGYVIRKVDVTTGTISTIAGNGSEGFSGDGGPATAAKLEWDVNCSAIDAWGNLYIADPNNNRIRRITYDASSVNEVETIAGNVSIYPNPIHGNLTISAEGKIKRLLIIDALGKVVFNDIFGINKVDMNVANLPSGTYFVKVNGVYAGKFVKE